MYNSKNLAEDIHKHRGTYRKPTLDERYPTLANLARMAVDMGYESSRSMLALCHPTLDHSHTEAYLERKKQGLYDASIAAMAAAFSGREIPGPLPVVDIEYIAEPKLEPIYKVNINTEEFNKQIDNLKKAMDEIEKKRAYEVIVIDSAFNPLDIVGIPTIKNHPFVPMDSIKIDIQCSKVVSMCGCSNPNRTENFAGGEKFHVCAKSKGGCGKEVP